MEFNKKLTLVLDVDEVLLYISPFWTEMLHKNIDFFGKYLNLNPNYNKKNDYYTILFRDKFDLIDFFENDYTKSLDKNGSEYKSLMERFFYIFNHKDFYKNVDRTRMSYAIEELSKSQYCKEIYILTRHIDNSDSYLNKEKRILEIFKDSNNKLKDIIRIPIGKSKGKILRDLQDTIGYDVVYDDELNNLYDIMKNKDEEIPIDIYIPKLGYNEPTEELMDISLISKTGIRYYDIEFQLNKK